MKMPIYKYSLIFSVLLGAATAALAQPASQNKAAASSTTDKASVEVDFWKSVERMDTADAYAAYLEAYPNGRFALLARLAMKRTSGGAQPASASAVPVPPPVASTVPASAPASVPATTPMQVQAQVTGGKLNAWSEPASGAITLDAGHKIRGPGVITVGRLGARKQLPIPEGEWVVVAATDHDSDTQPRHSAATGAVLGHGAVKLTTMTLAQFQGTIAGSLLVVTFNRVTNDMPRFTWKSAEQCVAAADQAGQAEPGAPAEYRHTAGGGRHLRLCVQVRHEANGIPAVFAPEHRKEINQNLSKLGGRLGGFNTETDLYLVDRYNAYIRITRLDCTEAQQGRPACAIPGIQPTGIAAQVAWAKAYAPSAQAGFDRDLALPELKAFGVTATN